MAASSPPPRIPGATVRALGEQHVSAVSPSSDGGARQQAVYNARTWRLDKAGCVNAPTVPYRVLITPSSGDKMDKQCLQYIAGTAVVRSTSGRFNKPCDQAAAWLQALVKTRKAMRGIRNDWVQAASFVSDNMLGLLLCLRYSFRKENRNRFRLMCDNYGVHSAASLAPLVTDALFVGSQWSGIYQAFNFQSSSVYHGKFHGSESWSCWQRAKGHYGQMHAAEGVGKDDVQEMYRYMARNGGVESWFILPVLRCPAIPKSQLNAIEQRYIRADHQCLNTQHTKGKGAPKGCDRPHKCEVLDFTATTKLRENLRTSMDSATVHPAPIHIAKRG